MDDRKQTCPLPACRLERILGKPPGDWTADDLVDLVEDRGIRIVSLMHVGGDGWMKTLDFLPQSRCHLMDILQGGERADGSSLFPRTGLASGASDIVLRPRLERAFLDPFSPEPALVVLSGHRGRDGEPLPQSPDTIVRRAWTRLTEKLGVDLWALGEVEYFLGKRSTESDIYGRTERGYHASAPFVFGEGLRRRAIATLADIGVPVKYAHSEVGYIEAGERDDVIWEQHEVELALAPLPDAADGIALAHWVLKNLVHREGMRLSFEPIVRVGHAGSGLHIHFSPVVDGEHRGGPDENGELPDPAKWLIAGLVRAGGALMAFGNRTEGSFIRLTQGKEVPNTFTWGEFDRNALVRLPVVARAADGRAVSTPTVEFRLADGSAHQHLLLAGVAQAAAAAGDMEDLDGLLARTSSKHARVQPGSLTPVPRSTAGVAKALARLREVLEADGVFPPALLDQVMQRG